MSDDPLEVLRGAGVECDEVRDYGNAPTAVAHHAQIDDVQLVGRAESDAALLALAQLVAKYKWMNDHDMFTDFPMDGGDPVDRLCLRLERATEYINRCWDEHTA